MSDVEYEYDTPSDSEEEEATGRQCHWKEIQKRLKFTQHGITITLNVDDSISNLYFLLSVISEGISLQTITYQYHIELLHNAIVRNPSKRTGPMRLKDMKRLETLLKEDETPLFFVKDVLELKMNTDEEIVRICGMPFLKCLSVSGPVRRIEIEDVESLWHISIQDAPDYPVIIGTMPHKITLNNVQRIQLMSSANMGLDTWISNTQIVEWFVRIMGERLQIGENVVVECYGGELKSYKEWKELSQKKLKILRKI